MAILPKAGTSVTPCHSERSEEPPPFAERKGARGMLCQLLASPVPPCIPRSHRFACSRPLTQAKGAGHSPTPQLWISTFVGMTGPSMSLPLGDVGADDY